MMKRNSRLVGREYEGDENMLGEVILPNLVQVLKWVVEIQDNVSY